MSKKAFRVLFIPPGEKVDANGRDLGDDWTLIQVLSGDGQFFITTDHVRASEFDYVLSRTFGDDWGDLKIAEFIAEALNRAFEENG